MSEAEQGARLPLKPVGEQVFTWEALRRTAREAFLAGWGRHGQALASLGQLRVSSDSKDAHDEATSWVARWLPGEAGERAHALELLGQLKFYSEQGRCDFRQGRCAWVKPGPALASMLQEDPSTPVGVVVPSDEDLHDALEEGTRLREETARELAGLHQPAPPRASWQERVAILERRLDALERTTNEGLAARATAHELDVLHSRVSARATNNDFFALAERVEAIEQRHADRMARARDLLAAIEASDNDPGRRNCDGGGA